jgi:hypothetical protein
MTHHPACPFVKAVRDGAAGVPPPDLCGPCRQLAGRPPAGAPEPSQSLLVKNGARNDCVHLGPVVSRTTPDGRPTGCGGCHPRACEVYGTCTTGIKYEGVACCARVYNCPSYESDTATPSDYPKKPQDAQERPLTARQCDMLAALARTPTGTEIGDPRAIGAKNRGVVQCVGGSLYFSLAFLSLSALRDTGCTLPVEWWALGRHELDPEMERLAATLGATVRYAEDVIPSLERPPRRLNGWELKPFSILHSGFDEVLFLDADNNAVRDPTFLFDDPGYLETGAVLWPDIPPSKRKEWIPDVCWHMAGLPPAPDVRACESGQLLFDKRKKRRGLEIVMHMNEWSDEWYGVLFGDKDTFVIGLMADAYYPHPMTEEKVAEFKSRVR